MFFDSKHIFASSDKWQEVHSKSANKLIRISPYEDYSQAKNSTKSSRTAFVTPKRCSKFPVFSFIVAHRLPHGGFPESPSAGLCWNRRVNLRRHYWWITALFAQTVQWLMLRFTENIISRAASKCLRLLESRLPADLRRRQFMDKQFLPLNGASAVCRWWRRQRWPQQTFRWWWCHLLADSKH